MDGTVRGNIKIGAKVQVVQKQDQRKRRIDRRCCEADFD